MNLKTFSDGMAKLCAAYDRRIGVAALKYWKDWLDEHNINDEDFTEGIKTAIDAKAWLCLGTLVDYCIDARRHRNTKKAEIPVKRISSNYTENILGASIPFANYPLWFPLVMKLNREQLKPKTKLSPENYKKRIREIVYSFYPETPSCDEAEKIIKEISL